MVGETGFATLEAYTQNLSSKRISLNTYFHENQLTLPLHRSMRDLVLSHLHVHMADFLSQAYEVLNGRKHDFASTGDRATQGSEEQTAPNLDTPLRFSLS